MTTFGSGTFGSGLFGGSAPMANKNAQNIFAASTNYAVWTGLLGISLPTTTLSTPAQLTAAGLYEIGLVTDDGITENHDVNDNFVYDLLGQLQRNIRNQEQRAFGFTGLEDNRAIRELKYPGSTLTTTGGTAEVQTVTLSNATGGSFTLSGGSGASGTTSTIAYNAPANNGTGNVQSAIQTLPGLSAATVTGSAGGPYTVTFPVSLGNVAQLTANGTGLTGSSPTVTTATTTQGVGGTNSRAVGSGTGLNTRVFYITSADGPKTQAFLLNNGEAQHTGDSTISGGGPKTSEFNCRAYPDAAGNYFYLIDNDPAQSVAFA